MSEPTRYSQPRVTGMSPTTEWVLATDCDDVRRRLTNAKEQVAALTAQLAELRRVNAQWQHKWSTAVGVGTRNTAREADRADRAEAEATALREALAKAEAALIETQQRLWGQPPTGGQ